MYYASSQSPTRALLYYAVHFTGRALAPMMSVVILLALFLEPALSAAAWRLSSIFLQTCAYSVQCVELTSALNPLLTGIQHGSFINGLFSFLKA